MDALCLDFINSEFRDFRGRWVRDDLQQPVWMEQFLAKWGLQTASLPDADVLVRLVALRTLLRRMVESLATGQLASTDLAELNSLLRKGVFSRSLLHAGESYRVELIPLQKDWEWVQAEIAASFAHLLADCDVRRLKICANTHCRWVFYDESKSRTRSYCTADKCANLLKVRRFRARNTSDI
ncbi:MAG TPA: CGNR zinc finger domain-containing protein [Ktedonobacteraceae bacterium]|jgi:predicted RNA-binding Zn ribbon-like protein|nr:CGNR zinc finger domain-containing protein [Ktedonobacteraceae bacterium]